MSVAEGKKNREIIEKERKKEREIEREREREKRRRRRRRGWWQVKSVFERASQEANAACCEGKE